MSSKWEIWWFFIETLQLQNGVTVCSKYHLNQYSIWWSLKVGCTSLLSNVRNTCVILDLKKWSTLTLWKMRILQCPLITQLFTCFLKKCLDSTIYESTVTYSQNEHNPYDGNIYCWAVTWYTFINLSRFYPKRVNPWISRDLTRCQRTTCTY